MDAGWRISFAFERVARHHSARSLAKEPQSMSTVIITGAVILTLALLAMFFFSQLRLKTIALLLAGIALLYVGAVAWFSSALDSALKRRSGPEQVDHVPRKVVESDHFNAATNGVGGAKTKAP